MIGAAVHRRAVALVLDREVRDVGADDLGEVLDAGLGGRPVGELERDLRGEEAVVVGRRAPLLDERRPGEDRRLEPARVAEVEVRAGAGLLLQRA